MKLRVEYSCVGDRYEVTMTVMEIEGFSVFGAGYKYMDSRNPNCKSRIIQYCELSTEKDDNKIKTNEIVSFRYVEDLWDANQVYEHIVISCDKNSVDEITGLLNKVSEIKEAIGAGFKKYQECKKLDRAFRNNNKELFEVNKDGKIEMVE